MRRNDEQSQGQLFRAELSESVDHARRAAGYAAGGVKAAVAPTKDRVREATQRVRNRTRTEETKVSSRVPKLAGLLVVGAAIGAVTAFVLRKRRQQQWEEYDPADALAAERSGQPGDVPSKAQPSQAESQI